MKSSMINRTLASTLIAGGLALSMGGLRATHADEVKSPEPPAPKAEVPPPPPPAEPPAAEAPAAPVTPQAEPDRISGKIYKVDVEGKVITVLVEPDKNKSGRAYKRYKLVLDDKSLVLVDQQPSTISSLVAGQLVEVGYFKKGKDQVVDTVVVLRGE
jgi:hypothetical protein